MNYALFVGCQIPAHLTQYETSARAVLSRLGVGLVDVKEFACCGYPLRNLDLKTSLLFAARNLALAARENLQVMTLCKCCFGNLKKAAHLLKEESSLRAEINELLQREALSYEAEVEVKHLLSVLFDEVGLEAIKEKVVRPFADLPIATHYGCHALRPSKIMAFDDPVAPSLFDQLVELTGAKSIYWPAQLECCGAPLLGINDELSMDLTEKKRADAKQHGAQYLCAACTYCQIQFDAVQQMMASSRGTNHELPSLLYPQLLGLSMGLEPQALALELNQLSLDGIEEFYFVPEPEEEEVQEAAEA